MVNKKTKVLPEKQATLLMASSAKLSLGTDGLCLVGMLVLIICEADDFQIDQPLLLLEPGLQLPQPQWFVSSVNTASALPPSKGILPPSTSSEPVFYGIAEYSMGFNNHLVSALHWIL